MFPGDLCDALAVLQVKLLLTRAVSLRLPHCQGLLPHSSPGVHG